MRKSKILLPAVKDQILAMQGDRVRFAVHHGRNRYKKYTGILECVYPCLFTIRVDDPTSINVFSYSYNDILCGHVRIARCKSAPFDAPDQTLSSEL